MLLVVRPYAAMKQLGIMAFLVKMHNRHKGQEPVEDWEEHHEWLTVKASKKAKIAVAELD